MSKGSIIRQQYQEWVEDQRKKKGIITPTSGELSQLTESGNCSFCGSHVKTPLTQREMMIILITSIKSNQAFSLVGSDYLGFLIGILRQRFTPDVTVNECQEIIHSVTHLKDQALDFLADSNNIYENIYNAKLKLCVTDRDGNLIDNPNCTCECHKRDLKFCDNCSTVDNMAKNGIWHLGKEEKEMLFEFAKQMGINEK